MADSKKQPGYLIPEDAWNALHQEVLLLKAMSNIASGPVRNITIPSNQFTSLIDQHCEKLLNILSQGQYIQF